MRKIKIVIDYEIQYADGFDPEEELQLAYFNPVSEKYEDCGDIFEVENPLSDEKNFDVDESDGTYSNHEHKCFIVAHFQFLMTILPSNVLEISLIS